jgi:DNA-binding MarR family transcriptional regulator
MTQLVDETALRLGEFLPFRLSVLSNTISKQIAEKYQETFGLTLWQWRVMAVIGETPGLGASDIVARTAMDKVAVSRAVAGLLTQKHLKRVAASDDGRRAHLHLTTTGQDVYERIVPIAQAELARIAAALSAVEIMQLNKILEKLSGQVSPDRPLW